MTKKFARKICQKIFRIGVKNDFFFFPLDIENGFEARIIQKKMKNGFFPKSDFHHQKWFFPV